MIKQLFGSTMLSKNISIQDKSKNYQSNLQALGWSPFFQDQFRNDDKDLVPARVIGVGQDCYRVTAGNTEQVATLAGRILNDQATSYPAVGDWVLLKDSMIVAILSRQNCLQRKASGGKNLKRGEHHIQEQIIATNIDYAFIVCGLDRDFNLRRLERYLTLVYNCSLSPVFVLTKADLCSDPQQFVAEVESIAFGVPIYLLSLDETSSLEEIKNLLTPNKTGALIGSSGVGKSTLINRLLGSESRATNSVGTRVGKGRHTTTSRDLISLPSGGMVIDNPGIREVGIAQSNSDALESFEDIEALAPHCKFSDCTHSHEPGCRILHAIAAGELSADRIKSYQKLKNELSYAQMRQSKSASRVEKERWKHISQKARSIKKQRE